MKGSAKEFRFSELRFVIENGKIRMTGAFGSEPHKVNEVYTFAEVQIAGEHRTVPPDELAAGELSEEEEVRLSQTLEEHIRSLWQACSEANCDLFFFRRSLRRASRELFAKWKELPLSELDVRVHARAKSLR